MRERDPPRPVRGLAFDQFSCHGSQAQEELTTLAANIVDYFEGRVGYQDDPDPDKATWKIDEYRPRGKEMLDFDRAAHARYSKADFNTDELAFARAFDRVKGVIWARNPTTERQGYGIPLPKKVGDSSTFYPDFLIWKKSVCWSVDTTGRHLLDEKVRGKLVALESPVWPLWSTVGSILARARAKPRRAGALSWVGRTSSRPSSTLTSMTRSSR